MASHTPHLITVRDIKNNETQIPVNKLHFRPSVYGLLIKNNQILLSPQFENGYDFPGGGVELGETLEQGLIREFKEETGITVKKTKLLYVTDDFFIHPITQKAYHTILIYYLCEYVEGQISTKGFDKGEQQYAKKAEWINISETQNLKFYNPIDSHSLIQKAQNLANG